MNANFVPIANEIPPHSSFLLTSRVDRIKTISNENQQNQSRIALTQAVTKL